MKRSVTDFSEVSSIFWLKDCLILILLENSLFRSGNISFEDFAAELSSRDWDSYDQQLYDTIKDVADSEIEFKEKLMHFNGNHHPFSPTKHPVFLYKDNDHILLFRVSLIEADKVIIFVETNVFKGM